MPQESMSYIKGVFLLVIPKKLKYEKVLKYGTGHHEIFLTGHTKKFRVWETNFFL